jgi:hypothetical protein
VTAQESEHLCFETTTASIGIRSDAISQTRWEANRSGDGGFLS